MMARVSKTLAALLLASLAGCASMHHRKVVQAPVTEPEAPELSQTPLYSPEMSENNPKTPSLPPATTPQAVVAAPEPPPQKPKKQRKVKPVTPPPAKAGETEVAGPTAASGGGATTSGMDGASGAAEKKAPETQAHAGNSAAPSPIGELTAGDSAAAAQTSRQAEDLIKLTQDGVDKIKRTLTADEKKTVAEIAAFLKKAQQALQNGDVDGAYGLATKAKLLLDELTTP